MAARFKQVDSGLPPLKDNGRGILYQCRMQYLKSREGGNRSKTRRKESAQFSCLDERMHVPCSSEILLPPNELMTRSKAFRHAFWRHHKEPTMKTVKKLEFGDKRNEKMYKKRTEILSRIEATTRARKESELRRRAERVMNHSMESMEDDSESDSESVIPSADDGVNLQDDDSVAMNPLSPSSNRRKARTSMFGAPKMKRQDEPINKISLPPLRVTMTSRSNESRGKENTDESAFSFLSDWSKKDKQKIRW